MMEGGERKQAVLSFTGLADGGLPLLSEVY